MERFPSRGEARPYLRCSLEGFRAWSGKKIESEYNELQEKMPITISSFDRRCLKGVLISELEEIRDKSATTQDGDSGRRGRDRHRGLIDEGRCVYTLTHAGYISACRRNGQGSAARRTRDHAQCSGKETMWRRFSRLRRRTISVFPLAGRV
jgi:DNA gyrase/topoisomerase IV subunit A